MPDSPKKSNTYCKACGKEFEQEYPGYSQVCERLECIKTRKAKYMAGHIKEFMVKAGIPPRFHDLKTSRDLQSYINSPRGVYLHGKAGRGKTVMACSIAREIILKGDYIEYYSSPKLIMQLQDSFKGEGDSAFEMLEKISRKEVIILDDLGAEKLTDFVRQSLYFLINEREQWMKKTIITSNYSLEELDRYIDGRISSRIAGMCDIIEVSGEDRRIKK